MVATCSAGWRRRNEPPLGLRCYQVIQILSLPLYPRRGAFQPLRQGSCQKVTWLQGRGGGFLPASPCHHPQLQCASHAPEECLCASPTKGLPQAQGTGTSSLKSGKSSTGASGNALCMAWQHVGPWAPPPLQKASGSYHPQLLGGPCQGHGLRMNSRGQGPTCHSPCQAHCKALMQASSPPPSSLSQRLLVPGLPGTPIPTTCLLHLSF